MAEFTLRAVEYPERRLEFFKKQLAAAHRRLDWSLKHNPDWDDNAEKGEVVSFYEWAVKMAENEPVCCKNCKHHRERNEYERKYLAEGVLICTSPDATDDCCNAVWPDHWCSYGERRDTDG